jgi:ATP-dependent Lhr-like helicase
MVARALLHRYGIVFFRVLAREGGWLPPWRDLVRVYRRLEARGEIRGGRFVAGFSGEQYALPEAVGLLREARRRPHDNHWVSLCGADPLNLAGVLTPGARLASLTGNRLVFRDGLPIASLSAGKIQFLTDLDQAAQWEAEKRLVRSAARGAMADLA